MSDVSSFVWSQTELGITSLMERTLLTLAVLCIRNPPYIKVSDAVSPGGGGGGGGEGCKLSHLFLFVVSLPSSI